jgi:hypothetical protein
VLADCRSSDMHFVDLTRTMLPILENNRQVRQSRRVATPRWLAYTQQRRLACMPGNADWLVCRASRFNLSLSRVYCVCLYQGQLAVAVRDATNKRLKAAMSVRVGRPTICPRRLREFRMEVPRCYNVTRETKNKWSTVSMRGTVNLLRRLDCLWSSNFAV